MGSTTDRVVECVRSRIPIRDALVRRLAMAGRVSARADDRTQRGLFSAGQKYFVEPYKYCNLARSSSVWKRAYGVGHPWSLVPVSVIERDRGISPFVEEYSFRHRTPYTSSFLKNEGSGALHALWNCQHSNTHNSLCTLPAFMVDPRAAERRQLTRNGMAMLPVCVTLHNIKTD